MRVDVMSFPWILFTQWEAQVSSVQFNDFNKCVPHVNPISIKIQNIKSILSSAAYPIQLEECRRFYHHRTPHVGRKEPTSSSPCRAEETRCGNQPRPLTSSILHPSPKSQSWWISVSLDEFVDGFAVQELTGGVVTKRW